MTTRLAMSLVLYVLWILVTLLGAKILLGGEEAPLDEMVKNGIGWQFVGAIAVLVGFIYARRWCRCGPGGAGVDGPVPQRRVTEPA